MGECFVGVILKALCNDHVTKLTRVVGPCTILLQSPQIIRDRFKPI
jgi:hypothetical protein